MLAQARNFLSTIILAAPPVSKTQIIRPSLSIVMASKKFACSLPDAKVVHDPESREFRIELVEGRAFLVYKLKKDILNVLHTEVPKEAGGKGYGKLLAQAALKHVDENKYRVASECDYFRHYVETYEPEYLKKFQD